MITGKYPSLRLRRLRKYNWSRKLVQENSLSSADLIYPIFLIEGKNNKQPIKSMPGVYRYTIDRLGTVIENVIKNEKTRHESAIEKLSSRLQYWESNPKFSFQFESVKQKPVFKKKISRTQALKNWWVNKLTARLG